MIPRVFENENLAVLIKEPGELSTPGRFKDDRPILGLMLQDELKTQVFPIHRLDFEVGGLIIYAKNARAHEIGQKWFEKKLVQKTYRAWTGPRDFSGWPDSAPREDRAMNLAPHEIFHWKCQILRGKKRSFVSPQGDWAETEAEFLTENKDQKILSWDLRPKTGRAHQLRLELARHGFAILGDSLYGSKVKASNKDSIFLWAYSLNFKNIEPQFRLGIPEELKIDIPFENWLLLNKG